MTDSTNAVPEHHYDWADTNPGVWEAESKTQIDEGVGLPITIEIDGEGRFNVACNDIDTEVGYRMTLADAMILAAEWDRHWVNGKGAPSFKPPATTDEHEGGRG